MILIYVARPLTSPNGWVREQNIRRAEEAAVELISRGYAVICVHSLDRFQAERFNYEVWMSMDIEILSRCDACFMVPSWENSKGAVRENNWCHENDYPVFYDMRELDRWARAFKPDL